MSMRSMPAVSGSLAAQRHHRIDLGRVLDQPSARIWSEVASLSWRVERYCKTARMRRAAAKPRSRTYQRTFLKGCFTMP
jgi:hypothetical protein